ncbi:MAG: YceI family protein [Fimbriimonadaceae bacterium]|nr:YceI family protein [Fimbriimonadaceae bacterium]
MKHLRTTLALSSLAVLALTAQAAPIKFAIGASGRAAAQVFTVDSEAELEDFTGITHAVTGNVVFDPATKKGSGRIEIDLTGLDTGIPLRNEHMRSAQWLDTANNPRAVFATESVRHKVGDTYTVTGKLTLKGVTRTVTAPVTVKHIKQSEATQKAGFKGDVLQVKTSFRIKLSDYNVTIPAPAQGKVNDSVTVKLTAFGASG